MNCRTLGFLRHNGWVPVPVRYLAHRSNAFQCSVPGLDRCPANSLTSLDISGAIFFLKLYLTLTSTVLVVLVSTRGTSLVLVQILLAWYIYCLLLLLLLVLGSTTSSASSNCFSFYFSSTSSLSTPQLLPFFFFLLLLPPLSQPRYPTATSLYSCGPVLVR
jgi:hypothetical protein